MRRDGNLFTGQRCDPKASDPTIMSWAKQNGYIVFTHDLDFGVLLALTQADGPSVIQLRADDVLPEALAPMIIAAIRKLQTELAQGALVTIDPVQ